MINGINNTMAAKIRQFYDDLAEMRLKIVLLHRRRIYDKARKSDDLSGYYFRCSGRTAEKWHFALDKILNHIIIRLKVKESQTFQVKKIMANISDIIEQFILSALSEGNKIEIGRNELANHFSVAPSQINYVLSTRFTVDRGYIIESRRGGGGYIIVARLDDDSLDYINEVLSEQNSLTYKEGVHITERLALNGIITEEEGEIIKAAISDKALNNPFNIADNIRASVIKEIIIKLMMDKQKK